MSLDKRKCDPELGKKIRKHLQETGVETPLNPENDLSVKEKISVIEEHFKVIMETLGLDLEDDSLCETPKRVAKMFVSEIFYGLDEETFPKCTTIENKFQTDEMVVERNVNVKSSCEHHFVTIDGYATVAYIPGSKVIGLSKINRIVEYFSKRPQVQERLTRQIHAALCHILETDHVAVVIDARHFCVSSRGIEDVNSSTVTSKLSGAFKDDPATRAEFMELSRKS